MNKCSGATSGTFDLYNVTVGDDTGQYVCNDVYYHALNTCGPHGPRCVFVHTPPIITIVETKAFSDILERTANAYLLNNNYK